MSNIGQKLEVPENMSLIISIHIRHQQTAIHEKIFEMKE